MTSITQRVFRSDAINCVLAFQAGLIGVLDYVLFSWGYRGSTTLFLGIVAVSLVAFFIPFNFKSTSSAMAKSQNGPIRKITVVARLVPMAFFLISGGSVGIAYLSYLIHADVALDIWLFNVLFSSGAGIGFFLAVERVLARRMTSMQIKLSMGSAPEVG